MSASAKLLLSALLVSVSCMTVSVGSAGQSLRQPTPDERKSLEQFLQKKGSSRYAAAFVDLRDDQRYEVIVQLTDNDWCGTGGCRTLILEPEGLSYRVVNNFLIAWPPIRVLATKSHGWHDVSIWVAGGGVQPGYESRLSFNGKLYPVSTALLESAKMTKKAHGLVAIGER